ncbi:DUF2510 domain-containing protein [Streptomyces beihaiensis]|uniref:DUF2510 domain-containing protein n=1 Tax=Streptomyces beihaiensis TaxID=2984495 RepID=A0ABT3TNI4_9ACTN|nr:DUF2510 domain-containing protein [Streptomyces beihaiensis]MCX3058608.1 DUF2510 domain-containing protein [Streptomyces beihaiensis]
MTSQTPAGWYPDPGQVEGAPRTERWWDGGRWTDQIRPATTPPPHPPQAPAPTTPGAAPAPAPGAPPVPGATPPVPGATPYAQQPVPLAPYPAYGDYPGYSGQLPPKPRSRGRVAVAAGITVVVLAGIGVGVYALTSNGGHGKGTDKAGAQSRHPRQGAPGGGDPGGGSSPSPQAPRAPRTPLDKGYATDVVSGVALPVLDGWTGTDGAGIAGVTTGPYKCPDTPKQTCVKGGASVESATRLKLDATTAEAAAKEDILKNAKASYGGKTYGGIVQHDELQSKKVTVAGQQGYLVRWNVDTKSDIDAWVESVAFPAPDGSGRLVVVRIGVDIPTSAEDKASGPDDTSIDKIVKGIKKARITGGATGGDGKGV